MADFDDKLKELNNTKDYTAQFDAQDIETNKVMAILAYLSWLVIIPLFAAKESKFARFHCNQGIVLAIAELVAGIVIGVLKGIPVIGWIFGLVGGLIELACVIMLVIGILNAANGQAKDLPVIGNIRLIK